MNEAQIAERAKLIAANPVFAVPEWWLTFDIAGDPEPLTALARRLKSEGWQNLEGVDTGWLNAKMPVHNDPVIVARAVCNALQILENASVQVVAIDVDTSPDVTVSRFKTLIESHELGGDNNDAG